MDSMQLHDLEEAIHHLSDGVDAVKMMVMGLDELHDSHVGGFYAVWRYLDEADREVHRHLEACLNAI